jgi:hypothetical protein
MRQFCAKTHQAGGMVFLFQLARTSDFSCRKPSSLFQAACGLTVNWCAWSFSWPQSKRARASRQNSDDGDDDEQFDQLKSTCFLYDGIFPHGFRV